MILRDSSSLEEIECPELGDVERLLRDLSESFDESFDGSFGGISRLLVGHVVSSTRVVWFRRFFVFRSGNGERSKPEFKRRLAWFRSFDMSFIDARKDLDRFKVDILSLDDRLESNSILGLDADNLRNFIWRILRCLRLMSFNVQKV